MALHGSDEGERAVDGGTAVRNYPPVLPLPQEVRDALSKLKTPCENDRESHFVCDEEATHKTPIGRFLCEEYATEHNEFINANRFIRDKNRYLAVKK